jgi:hypothetical protein
MKRKQLCTRANFGGVTMEVTIDGDTYYSLRHFSKKVDRSYNYLRHLVSECDTQAPEKRKELMPYVARRENKVWIKKEAEKLFP